LYRFICKVTYLSQILIIAEFSRQIFENELKNFIKSHPVAAGLFHTDTQTDGRTNGC